MFRLSALTVFVAALCALLPGRSFAGTTSAPLAPYCVKYSGGSGWCQGSFASFRADSDDRTYASAQTSIYANSYYFRANYRGLNVGCVVPTGWTTHEIQFRMLAQHKGEFYVAFDATGYCTDIAVSQASYYYPAK